MKDKKNTGRQKAFKLSGLLILGIITCFFIPDGSIFAAIKEFKITLLKTAEIKESQIQLGKISKIRCNSSELKRKLESLFLGKSPRPGRSRTIKRSFVILRLRQLGINSSQYLIQGPQKTTVKRKSILITKEKIKGIVKKYIFNKKEWNGRDVEIDDIQVYSDLAVPDSETSYFVVEEKNRHMKGILPLCIKFKSGKDFQKKIRVLVKIQIYSEVVVAGRPLTRHRKITAEDIWLQRVNIAGLPGNIVTDLQDVIGKRTRGYIRANSVLRKDHVEMPPLMKRGDMVLIVAETRGMKITAIGQVKKDGRLGERVSVMNLDSKKVIFAQVVDSQTVKIEF